MRVAGTLLGIILVLIGGFWILQGINIIPVGFMAGQIQYAVLGSIVAVVGIGLLWLVNRRTRSRGGTL